jgi:hypothetical protein
MCTLQGRIRSGVSDTPSDGFLIRCSSCSKVPKYRFKQLGISLILMGSAPDGIYARYRGTHLRSWL